MHCHAAATSYINAFFGAGAGPIFLSDVQCYSSAGKLLECLSRPILNNDCSHSADAGVGCEGQEKIEEDMERLQFFTVKNFYVIIPCGFQLPVQMDKFN